MSDAFPLLPATLYCAYHAYKFFETNILVRYCEFLTFNVRFC